MTSQPKRCSSITTSLPSSPEPSSITRLPEGASGVPIVVMVVCPEHECDAAHYGIASDPECSGRESLRPHEVRSRSQHQRESDTHPLQLARIGATFERGALHEQ